MDLQNFPREQCLQLIFKFFQWDLNETFLRSVAANILQEKNYWRNGTTTRKDVEKFNWQLPIRIIQSGHNFYIFPKEALLSFLEVVQTGVRGIVTDEKGEPLPEANIEVSGISEKNITASASGEYWRLLAPGNYWYAQQNQSVRHSWRQLSYAIKTGEIQPLVGDFGRHELWL